LLAATNNLALLNETFYILKFVVAENIIDAGVVIDMEFEIE